MKYELFYEKISAPLRGREKTVKAISVAERALVVLVAIAFLGVCARRAFSTPFSWVALGLTVGCPALCLAAVSLLRTCVKRKRPYENGIIPLTAKNASGNSFPSRHTASAFVIATVAIPVAVWLGVSLYVTAITIAFVRLLLGHHYPTDLLVGALLGVAFGLPTWWI